jgi:hypothetical protein
LTAYFPNGSLSDIAKIEGSPAYKTLMRKAVASNNKDLGLLYDSEYKLGALQTTLKSIRHSLPPWLGGHDQHHQPLSDMLKALKVAAESHLEAPLCTAAIVLPYYFTEPYYQILSNASASVSLNLPMLRIWPAGFYAAQAHGIDGNCEPYGESDPPKLVLTIEYTRAALTAILAHEECGVYQGQRVVQDTRLGLDGIQDGSDASWSDLERALRGITELPLKDGVGAGLKSISDVVLIGESAKDSRMQDVLQRVLAERYSSFATTSGYSGPIDPLFAGSRGAALYSWFRQERERTSL